MTPLRPTPSPEVPRRPAGSLLPPTQAPAAGGDHPGIVEVALRILRARKWVVLQALIIVPLLVAVLTSRQEEQYTAQASLLFRSSTSALLDDSGGGYSDPDRAAATNQELIDMPAVAVRAAAALGGGLTPADVDRMVTLDAAGQSDVINIQAQSTDPAQAAALANAYGDAYIAFRRDADREQLRDAIALVESNLEDLTAEEKAAGDGRTLRQRLDELKLRQSLQTGNAELVQRAAAPSDPSSPNLQRNIVLGIALGGLLGFALAALLERLDRRLRNVEAIEEAYGLPVVASIPASKVLHRGPRSIGDAVGATPIAESLRMLRANLRFLTVDRELRSLLIVSPLSGEGKSTIARYLAMTMAHMGDRAVLVEADLHKPGMLGGADRGVPGLSEVLVGSDLDDVLVEVSVADDGGDDDRALTVLPSGGHPPNPYELLERPRMAEVIAELEDRFDIVVLDTPPMSVISDASALLPHVDGVLVVSGIGQTTRDAARKLSKQLALLGARPLGVVANFARVERSGKYYEQS